MDCCSIGRLMDGDVVCYGWRDYSFCAFNIIITYRPSHPITYSSSFLFSWLHLSAFDSSSLFFGPQRCPFLISSLLFYSFFHFLCHLSCLTLTVYPDTFSSCSLCIFTSSQLLSPTLTSTNPTHPLSTQTALFYGHCSCVVPPSGDVNICSSACLENLWWARDSHHCSCVYMCVCFMIVYVGACT